MRRSQDRQKGGEVLLHPEALRHLPRPHPQASVVRRVFQGTHDRVG